MKYMTVLESMCAPIPTYCNPPIKIGLPPIKQIIINPPATIIIWENGKKTVCKTNEEYDPEVGVAMCIAKKYFGSRNQFAKAVKGAIKDFEERTWK